MSDKNMKCECGGNERKRKVSKEVSLAGRKVYVENVDAYVCDSCGETYFDGAALLRIEKQVQKRERIAA
jgi:YgiT-type zinc finger domain-containing protein